METCIIHYRLHTLLRGVHCDNWRLHCTLLATMLSIPREEGSSLGSEELLSTKLLHHTQLNGEGVHDDLSGFVLLIHD